MDNSATPPTPHYVDLHLHLLPEVDDGPRSVSEMIDLARLLESDCVREVTVTPHVNPLNPSRVTNCADLAEHMALTARVIDRLGIELKLHSGAEHFLTPELPEQVAAGTAPFLAGGPYMLVELPFNQRPVYTDKVLDRLLEQGVRPVLAHPERYSWVQTKPEDVLELWADGIILQCGAASLNGHYGPKIQKTADFIFGRGAYQLAGSDFHRASQPRLLSDMEATIAERFGSEMAHDIFHVNAPRVLTGEKLRISPPVDLEPSPKQKRLFGLI